MKRLVLIPFLALFVAAACGGKKPPVPVAPPPFLNASAPGGGSDTVTSRPPDPPPVPRDSVVASRPLSDPYSGKDVKDINDNSPLKAIYFLYDSDQLDDTAKKVLASNADVLKQYATWVVTVEGHCDERGTAEYNLALGDRRALAVRNYMLTLGVGAERLRTVSYGKEFPFDPGHDETAWSHNRRAHFMLTSK
ncbi:MAG: peptidoglycan-associated lipoprotein Pal [Acidobacteriota bacterium]